MSVSAIASSSTADSGLLSSLGINSGSNDAISTDLQAYTQAKNTNDTSSADAAIVQLKSDLATEQAQLLAGLEGSADTSENDTGSDLLSGLLALNSNSDIGTALESIQNLAAQGSTATATSQAAMGTVPANGTQDADTLGTTGTQVSYTA